jgi:hemolysin activation/secretion protein
VTVDLSLDDGSRGRCVAFGGQTIRRRRLGPWAALCLVALSSLEPLSAQTTLSSATPVADRVAARRNFPGVAKAVADRMTADPTILIVPTDGRLPQPKPAPPPAKPGDKPAAKGPVKPEDCFAIGSVEISGIVLVTQAEVRSAISSFLQACQGNTTVKGLLLSINALYASKGYITTQAYLPKQDLKKAGLIRIEIKPGRIAGIIYEEKPVWDQGTYFERLNASFRGIFAADSVDAFFKAVESFAEAIDDPLERPLLSSGGVRSAGAFVAKPGDILNLEEIQQGLDQMNKAPSSRAKSKLEPGKEPNTSVVRIANPQDDAFRLTVGYDTYGSVSTGVSRQRIEIARDNLIGVNETWRTGLTSSRNTNELTGSVAVPYGWWSLSLDGKYSDSLVPLGSVAELYTKTTTFGTAASWTALRTPEGRLDLSTGLRVYGTNRYINDVMLTPQTFSALDFGLTRTLVLGQNGMLTLGAKSSVGTKLFHATLDDPAPLSSAPRAQFRKLEGSAGLQLAVLDAAVLASNLTAQFATTPLYSPDQFTIGGLTSVRGFKAAPVMGDRGAHMRNELVFKLPVDAWLGKRDPQASNWLPNRFKALEGYGFVDGGYAFDVANRKTTLLAGSGVGVRIKDHRLTVDLSLARGIYQQGPATPLATEIYLNMGWKVF